MYCTSCKNKMCDAVKPENVRGALHYDIVLEEAMKRAIQRHFLEKIQGMAGHPDPAQACRNIIAEREEAKERIAQCKP